MGLHFALTVLIGLFGPGVQSSRERELELRPGPFPQIRGAELGQPVQFENEIDIHACFPVLLDGEVVGWVHRAHATSTLVLVQRCVEYDPSVPQTPGNRHGGVNRSWERVGPGSGNRQLRFVRVTPKDWGLFANPSFCGPFAAYWGTPDDLLIPSIHNPITGARVGSRSLGPIVLETDDESFLPSPVWDPSCATASFDATPVGKGRVDLRVRR